MKVKRIGLVVFLGLIGMAVALLSGCSSGVSQDEYDTVKQQVSSKDQEISNLRTQLEAAQAAGQGTAALQEQLAAKEAELVLLQSIKPYVWTQTWPTPEPRAPATAVPPGYVAPTPVPPDAATVNEVFPFTFAVETLTGHQISEIAQFPSCVLTSSFRRGTHLVWRFEVFDTATAKRVTSLDTPSIKLVLPNGEEKAARFARKAGTGPWTWVTAWDVPADYPLGAVEYTIVVTKDGRTGTYDPNKAALVNMDRGIDQRLSIVD